VSELTDSGSDGEGGAEPSARALPRGARGRARTRPPSNSTRRRSRYPTPTCSTGSRRRSAAGGSRSSRRTSARTAAVVHAATARAIPRVDDGENCLVAADGGSGKTLAAFTAVLDDLFARDRAGTLDNSVYCLYVSPLKSLANDIERNLEAPLNGIAAEMTAASESDEDEEVDPGVRQAIRHGDTSKADRRAMLETPHVLNTTPETLAILLNAPRFREKPAPSSTSSSTRSTRWPGTSAGPTSRPRWSD